MVKKTLTLDVSKIDMERLQEQKEFALNQMKIEKKEEEKKRKEKEKKDKQISNQLKNKLKQESKKMEKDGYYKLENLDPYLYASFSKRSCLCNFLKNISNFFNKKVGSVNGREYYKQTEYYFIKHNSREQYIKILKNCYSGNEKDLEKSVLKYNNKMDKLYNKHKDKRFLEYKLEI